MRIIIMQYIPDLCCLGTRLVYYCLGTRQVYYCLGTRLVYYNFLQKLIIQYSYCMFVDEHEQESVEMRRLDWSEAASYHD